MNIAELWDVVMDRGRDLGEEGWRKAARYFSFIAFEHIDLPWRLRDAFIDALGAAAVGNRDEWIVRGDGVLQDGDVPPLAVRALNDAIDRAAAWKEGRSLEGWEAKSADRVLELVRRLGPAGDEFFRSITQHPEVGGASMVRTAKLLKDLAAEDPSFTSPETEFKLRRAMTHEWGTASDYRHTHAGIVEILKEAIALEEMKDDPRWRRFLRRLDDVFSPFGGREDGELDAISELYSDGGRNFDPGLVSAVRNMAHWAADGRSFTTAKSGTLVASNIRMLKKNIEYMGPSEEAIIVKKMEDIVSAAAARMEELDALPPEYSKGAVDPPYGKFIFAEPGRRTGVPTEKDTPRERAAYAAMQNHINSNQPLPSHVALELMSQLEDGSYGSILKEPTAKWIYRGMWLPTPDALKMLGEKDVEVLKTAGSKVVDRLMKPRKGGEGSSSWTTSMKVAVNYAAASLGENDPISLVLVARTADNKGSLLSGPGGLYKVSGLDDYASESEVVALGPVRIHKIYWQSAIGNKLDNFYEDIEETNPTTEGVSLVRSFIRLLLEKHS